MDSTIVGSVNALSQGPYHSWLSTTSEGRILVVT